MTFSNNTGEWWALGLFYKQSDLEENTAYKLSLNINTTKAGKITLNGQVITLVAGDNNVEIYYNERWVAYDGPNSYPISCQLIFGVEGQNNSDINAATVKISNITWTKDTEKVTLQAPSFTYANDVINITDPNTV